MEHLEFITLMSDRSRVAWLSLGFAYWVHNILPKSVRYKLFYLIILEVLLWNINKQLLLNLNVVLYVVLGICNYHLEE